MMRRVAVTAVLLALATLAVLGLAAYAPRLGDAAAWQALASPGPLSKPHGFLQADCAACHTPVTGVEDVSCTGCHANESVLLARQPTAFHANVSDSTNCVACHREHDPARALRTMDHAAFTDIVLRRLQRYPETHEAGLLFEHLRAHRRDAMNGNRRLATGISLKETLLDCSSCHSSSDPHTRVFGDDCAACHGTTSWSITGFTHPSPASVDCAQCHLAPLSHYMEHFEMMSKPVARIEHADPEQCHLCHQTTSWNDIRGVGIYDHH